MSTIARRISRLEARLLETEPPRLFALELYLEDGVLPQPA